MEQTSHRDEPYGAGEERPPWVEEVDNPTWWDLAFGSYGDGYLEWITNRYYWDAGAPRTLADTRSLWDKRSRYPIDPLFVELNHRSGDDGTPFAA